ncbi:MAG: hypothetical protein RLY97_1275 [Pseudomonadota bacterium]
MKATQKDFANLAAKAAQSAHVFFCCGPDEAGAHSAALRIISLLPDAGERIEFSGADLKRDPVRLGDEARSNSLFGGARHIFIRAAGDDIYDAVENLLASDVAPCPVIIVASSATDKSRLAKLLAPRGDALMAMFYPPDLRSVADAVRLMGNSAGLKIGGTLAERIARAAGLDTRMAQSEVTKLALYLDASPESPKEATAEAISAIGASNEEDGFAALVNVVLNGERHKLPEELHRMQVMNLNAVGILLAFERRVGQLAQLTGKLAGGGNVKALIEAERLARRIFWKDVADLTTQLRHWGKVERLQRLNNRLIQLHRDLMKNSQNAELLLAHGLGEITREAARRG